MGPARRKKGRKTLVYRASASLYIIHSESGNWYEVTHADGRWACNCPGFKYRGTECKHIRMVGPAPEPASEPTKPVTIAPVAEDTCPRCHAAGAVKNGLRRNKSCTLQRYLCGKCGLRFSDNFGFEGQHADRKTITNAINLHYDGGMSSRQIQRHLERNGLRFSHVSILKWIDKYSERSKEFLESLPVSVGERWHADEIYVNGGKGKEGGEVLLMMSGRERFVLAHAESPTYKKGDGPGRVLKDAKERAGRVPKLFVTDRRPEFGTAHRDNYAGGPGGGASRHLYETHLRGQHCNNNVMERLNGTFRDFLKANRRIRKVTSKLVEYYVNYYNFFRRHMGLGGDTPAERAGIVIEGDDKMLTVIQNAARYARKAKGPPGA